MKTLNGIRELGREPALLVVRVPAPCSSACVPNLGHDAVFARGSHGRRWRHVDNMWVLGGELITELNYTPSLRKAPVEKVLADLIKDGGPILHGNAR